MCRIYTCVKHHTCITCVSHLVVYTTYIYQGKRDQRGTCGMFSLGTLPIMVRGIKEVHLECSVCVHYLTIRVKGLKEVHVGCSVYVHYLSLDFIWICYLFQWNQTDRDHGPCLWWFWQRCKHSFPLTILRTSNRIPTRGQ